MNNTDFSQRIENYARWKADLIREIDAYQKWLDKQELSTPENDLRIFEILESLRTDRVTIAFVAEFSRGKTELINAIFFADYQRRLLPSEAGRTTMCPTELFHDDKAREPYIRMLPIETRKQEMSISELRHDPMNWTHMPLNIDSADEMAEAFHEIVKTKAVSVEEATALGLYDADCHESATQLTADGQVEIPMWRHALISFPHPLLQQGLVVLDTPGLNALGSEPELTLNMLPNAQAVLFVLAADTGVTRSDREMWQNHVASFRATHKKGLLVALNKIDTLWDELKDDKAIETSISKQRKETASMLGISDENVFPLSAQKALLAKVKGDDALLEKSRLLALENALAEDVIPYKQEIVRDNIVSEIGDMIQETRSIVANRFNDSSTQLEELHNLSGRNMEVIEHLMKKTREEQSAYHKNVQSFQESHSILKQQAQSLLASLSVSSFDKMIAEARTEMSDSWTTHGLKIGMKNIFDNANETIKRASKQAEQIRRLVQSIYRKFHEEHGLPDIKPKVFSVNKYKAELERLHNEAEVFRNSPVTAMTEKYFVIKKFFISMVSHARNISFKAHKDASNWTKVVMVPLVSQIKEHKAMMDKRLDSLRRISESHETLDVRIRELETSCAELEQQLTSIDHILSAINCPIEAEDPQQLASAS